MEPLFEVRGWRARTWRERWPTLIFVPIVLAFFLGPLLSIAVIPLLFFGVSSFRYLSRGRISLFADRIEISSWSGALDSELILPLTTIRHVSVVGTSFRITSEQPDKLPEDYSLSILSVTAEDLFDHLVDLLEKIPGHQCSIEDPQALRCLRNWSFEELFPWQTLTRSGCLRIKPTGELILETGRDVPLRGTNFKGAELTAPNAGELDVRPALRVHEGRVVAPDGMVLGVVTVRAKDELEIDLSNGSSLVVRDSDLEYDERIVGELKRTDEGFVLEALQPLPESLVALVLMVWTRVGRSNSSLYSR